MWSKTPRPWHHILDVVPFFAGIAIFHRAPVNDWDVVFVGGGLIAIGVGSFWSTDMGMVADKRNEHRVEDDGFEDIDARQEERDRAAKWRANPAPVSVPIKTYGLVQYQNNTQQVKERDPRYIQWARAITYENTPMTQAKWAGKKRLFSKPEYVRWCAMLLERGVIAPINLKSDTSSYKPKGAYGRETIKKLADGVIYIPPPSAKLSEKDTHFLRAQMRKASADGEGVGE